jgi:hypothetical protein
MAQTGFTPIVTYNTATATTVPSAANLAQGELAVNVTDKKLYTKDSGGNVVLLASNGGDVTGPASSTNLAIPTFSGTGGKTLLNNSGATISAGVITATGFSGPLTGNVTGNVSGSSGSCTGNASTVTTNANLTGPITSVGNATSIASQTGTGTKIVVDNTPTLITPVLGVATATSINKMAITAPATSSTLAVADGKTLTANKTLTLEGTDSTTMTFPTTSATIARTDAAQTFTGTQTFGETILGTNAAKVFASGGVSIGNTTDPGATNLSVTGTIASTALTASQAVFSDANKKLVSNAITGTGNVVMSASPTFTGTIVSESQTLSTSLALAGAASAISGYFQTISNTSKYAWVSQSRDGGSHAIAAFRNVADSDIGSITGNNANVTYATSSDYRLKDNISPMVGALNIVSQLKPVTYTWKIDGSDGQGFIAHELQEIVPDCVVGEKDAINEDGSIKAQAIDTSFLVAILTAAIQELKAIVDTQAEQIKVLEAK